MARLLRSRPPLDQDDSADESLVFAETLTSPQRDHFRGIEYPMAPGFEYVNSSRKIRAIWRSPWLIISGLRRQRAESEEAGETIVVKRRESIPQELQEPQEPPRKRRRTSVSVARVPGSPSAQFQNSPPRHAPNVSTRAKRRSTVTTGELEDYKTVHGGSDGEETSQRSTQSPAESAQPDDVSDTQTIEPDIEDEAIQRDLKASVRLSNLARDDSEIPTVVSPALEASQGPERLETPSDPNELTEADLPPPFFSRSSTPSESSFSDPASYILATKYAPLPSPQRFVTALTKHAPTGRSTATLYELARNTQKALLAWQTEFLTLDRKTAPIGNPPKKPATGGREPQDPSRFEAAKEADLHNVHKSQELFGQTSAPNGNANTGRELRRRKDAGVIDGLNISEDDAGAGTESGKGKRARRPPRKFEGGRIGTVTPDVAGSGGGPTGPRRRKRAGDAGQRRSRFGALTPLDGQMSPVSDGSEAGDSGRAYTNTQRPSVANRFLRGAGRSQENLATRRRKQRVKSEKRSESMTAWWAARKQKAAEQRIKELRERGLLEVKETGNFDRKFNGREEAFEEKSQKYGQRHDA